MIAYTLTMSQAVRTEGATFRITLTDYLGIVTEQVAESRTEWLALSNAALHAKRPDARDRGGRSSTARRKPMYVRCQSVCVLPDGSEVPCGLWRLADPIEPSAVPAPALDDAAALAELARLLPGMAGAIA